MTMSDELEKRILARRTKATAEQEARAQDERRAESIAHQTAEHWQKASSALHAACTAANATFKKTGERRNFRQQPQPVAGDGASHARVMLYHNHESQAGALATATIIVSKRGKVSVANPTIGTREFDVQTITQADWDTLLVDMYESVLAR
jgi:hypothetical protein